MYKRYEVTIGDVTLITPAKDIRHALRAFRTMAVVEGMSPLWVKIENIKRSYIHGY